MYRVLLVSDNRLLLKQLYSYLEHELQFELLVVPFCTNTYERFVSNKSDLVVFDADNLIPFNIILQQLSQSHWSYHVILLSDRAETFTEYSNVIVLEKKNLNRQSLVDILMRAAQIQKNVRSGSVLVSLVWGGQTEFIPYPDAYFILLAKYVGKNKDSISNSELKRFKNFALHAGEVEIISISERNLLLSMRKTKMRSGFEFSELVKIIMKVFGNEYAIFFRENINWTRLNQAYAQLTAASDYGYFLAGESLDVSGLNKRIVHLTQDDIHDTLWRILQAILMEKNEDIRFLTKNLYLHQLKLSLDVYMCGYIRKNLSIIQNIMASVTHTGFSEIPGNYPSIEHEYLEMENIILSFCDLKSGRQPINPIVIHAIMKIYRCYPEDISLKSISHELSVNKIYLGRLFREQVGTTIMDFLQAIRYEIACYMLKFGSLRIAAIAKAVGYNDPGYFSRIFKKRTGVTPEHYREANQNRTKYESTLEIS